LGCESVRTGFGADFEAGLVDLVGLAGLAGSGLFEWVTLVAGWTTGAASSPSQSKL